MIDETLRKKTLDAFIGNLKEDENYYNLYRAKIAMAFIDECKDTFGKEISYNDLYNLSTKSATKFMDAFISDT